MAAAAGKVAFRLSAGIQNTGRPPIPQAYEWADEYLPSEHEGRPLLDMSQGVPGVPPPQIVLDALAEASAAPGSCGYLPNEGALALRKAMAEEMKTRYGRDADVSFRDIAITAGCNLAFVAVAIAIAGAGDEVILPVPWYFNHDMTLTMLGIKPVLLHTSAQEGFLPSVERCAELITPSTKAIVLCTPNNPTGAIYPPSLLASFAALARRRNIALVVDETYRDFILTGAAPHQLFVPGGRASALSSSDPALGLGTTSTSTSSLPADSVDWSWRSTFIHLFSFSKSYAIPGHRLGLVCASPDVLRAITTALDSLQICAPRAPQVALAPLLAGPALREFVRATAEAVAGRHGLFRERLPERWRMGSQGGYYAFVRHPFAGVRAGEVCRRLAVEMGVVTLPAGFFGPGPRSRGEGEAERGSVETLPVGEEERWVRFSVANVDDGKVELVCERLRESEERFGWSLD